MRAGDLTRRATLKSPVKSRDADGKRILSYVNRGTIWAKLLPLRGGEDVLTARLQSRGPAILSVRASSLTRQITSEWQVVVDNFLYEVKEVSRETQDRSILEFLMVALP